MTHRKHGLLVAIFAATAAAAGKPGAQQVQQETTIQLKYVTGKMSSDYITIHGGVNILKSIFAYVISCKWYI